MTITRNEIVQKGNGHFIEGTVAAGNTLEPGMAVQLDTSGNFVVGMSGADGERDTLYLVVGDSLLGQPVSATYPAGSRVKVYIPQAGDECLILVTAGADATAIGAKMINDVSTGMWIVTTGTVESEPFEMLEAGGTLAVDTLLLARCTGY